MGDSLLNKLTTFYSEVNVDRHLVCEPCGPTVAGRFDPEQTQVVLCENNIYSQGHMNDTLTHELVHAYDHCRAHVDWNNLQHIACTEVQSAINVLYTWFLSLGTRITHICS